MCVPPDSQGRGTFLWSPTHVSCGELGHERGFLVFHVVGVSGCSAQLSLLWRLITRINPPRNQTQETTTPPHPLYSSASLPCCPAPSSSLPVALSRQSHLCRQPWHLALAFNKGGSRLLPRDCFAFQHDDAPTCGADLKLPPRRARS